MIQDVFDEETEENIDNILECSKILSLHNQDGRLICDRNERMVDIKLDCKIFIHDTKIIILTRAILDCGSSRSLINQSLLDHKIKIS